VACITFHVTDGYSQVVCPATRKPPHQRAALWRSWSWFPRTWQHHAPVNQQHRLEHCRKYRRQLSSCSRALKAYPQTVTSFKYALCRCARSTLYRQFECLSGSNALHNEPSKDVTKDVAGHGDIPRPGAAYIRSSRKRILAPDLLFTYPSLAYKHRLKTTANNL